MVPRPSASASVFDAVSTWFSCAVPLIVTDPVGGSLNVKTTAALVAVLPATSVTCAVSELLPLASVTLLLQLPRLATSCLRRCIRFPRLQWPANTEQAVQAAGLEYVVGRARYTDNPRGCIIGEKEGFLKLIFRREDLKLLGVHAIGELASELVHIGLIAMTADCDATVFSKLAFNVPTLGALYQDATWRLINESPNDCRSRCLRYCEARLRRLPAFING